MACTYQNRLYHKSDQVIYQRSYSLGNGIYAPLRILCIYDHQHFPIHYTVNMWGNIPSTYRHLYQGNNDHLYHQNKDQLCYYMHSQMCSLLLMFLHLRSFYYTLYNYALDQLVQQCTSHIVHGISYIQGELGLLLSLNSNHLLLICPNNHVWFQLVKLGDSHHYM